MITVIDAHLYYRFVSDEMNTASTQDHRANGPRHWHEKNSTAYLSALEAIKRMMPVDKKHGVQICQETHPPLTAPGVPVYRPSPARTIDGFARGRCKSVARLPYDDCSLDFALICSCDGMADGQQLLFKEVYRALGIRGLCIVAFIDVMSPFGEKYLLPPLLTADRRRSVNRTEKIMLELTHAGFKHYEFLQTLLGPPEEVREVQAPIRGYGQGSFVVVQAAK